jgi:hypothetical protein
MAYKKEDFLKVFEQALGNVSVACKNFGCDNSLFYIWCKDDPEFKKKADAVKEIRKDFIESALDKKIKEGDSSCIIFAAKTQCKDRGYVETERREISGKMDIDTSVDVKKLDDKQLFNIADQLQGVGKANE